MSKFLFRSFALLGIAMLITVAVFVYLSVISEPSPTFVGELPILPITASTTATTTVTSSPRETLLPSIIPPAGFPLRMLPLSETQKSFLAAASIDIETFMITPAMIACGEEKIGKDRMFAISEGSAPSVFELTKLLPCLKA